MQLSKFIFLTLPEESFNWGKVHFPSSRVGKENFARVKFQIWGKVDFTWVKFTLPTLLEGKVHFTQVK